MSAREGDISESGLRTYAGYEPCPYCAKPRALGRRSPRMPIELRDHHCTERRPWTTEEDQALGSAVGYWNAVRALSKLGAYRSQSSIANRRVILGIRVRRPRSK